MRLFSSLARAALALYGLTVAALALGQRRLIYPGAYSPPPPHPVPPGVAAATLFAGRLSRADAGACGRATTGGGAW